MSAPILSLPWAEYAVTGFLGSSALHAWGTMGRASWSREYLETSYESKGTQYMIAGSALDCLLTEGRPAYESRYVVAPDGLDGRTKEGKAWKEANAAKAIIPASTAKEIEAVFPLLNEALGIAQPDLSTLVFSPTYRGDVGSLKVQTRPDIAFLGADATTFLDLKYVNPKAFDDFDRQFVDSRYFLQAGLFWGLAGNNPSVSFLLAESGTDLPRVKCVQVPERILSAGWDRCRKIVDEIVTAIESPHGMTDAISFEVLDIPAWAEARILD